MSKAEAAKLPPEWRTFAQREGGSSGFNVILNVAPPDGTRALVFCPMEEPHFVLAYVHCHDGAGGIPFSYQIFDSEMQRYGCTHWLPLVRPKNEVPF
jgi:hypothetical protein